ncbi:MAG: peptidylprolyl isomerase [Flavobacteriales bacterium]|nr:peptidylprolyl isomerase [Flavobacteriales bacterium]MCB9167039.1 peptidylprolyl isomerase [Flavobacteriales bacterium]
MKNALSTVLFRAILLAFLPILSAGSDLIAQKDQKATRPLVEIRTELGTIVVALFNETPQHRDNFLKLVNAHFYDSLLFHRVIPGFMVQGGDPNSKHAKTGDMLGNGGPDYTVPAEIVPSLHHFKGMLAAARQGDQVNPDRRSSGSQFYIVQGKPYLPDELKMMTQRMTAMGQGSTYSAEDIQRYAKDGGAPHLDGAYTVFGEVVEGLDVLDKIAAVPCDPRDRPLTDVHMWMRVLQ